VQLHGDETAEIVSRMRRRVGVIKAIRVRDSLNASQLAKFKRAWSILLDGFDARLRGGSGRNFNWKLAKSAGRKRRIFLAGGLTPDNAAEAVRAAQPFAIDVCSGVESQPGKKDMARMRALVAAVRHGTTMTARRPATAKRAVSPARRKRRT
jgi:phosphoribosylanthranilate isomerase